MVFWFSSETNSRGKEINAFGKENVEYLDDKTIAACIERVYKSIPAILEKIHFDPKHPENHNIKITNKKLPYASYEKWLQKIFMTQHGSIVSDKAFDIMINNGKLLEK